MDGALINATHAESAAINIALLGYPTDIEQTQISSSSVQCLLRNYFLQSRVFIDVLHLAELEPADVVQISRRVLLL